MTVSLLFAKTRTKTKYFEATGQNTLETTLPTTVTLLYFRSWRFSSGRFKKPGLRERLDIENMTDEEAQTAAIALRSTKITPKKKKTKQNKKNREIGKK